MLFQHAHQSRGLLTVIAIAVLLHPDAVRADKPTDDFNLGIGLWRKKRWTPAVEVFEQFLKDYPDHERVALATFYLGLSYNSLQQYSRSRDRFAEYLRLNPNSPNTAAAKYRLGECSYYLSEYEKAIDQLGEYTREYPGHKLIDWGRLQLGEALIQAGRWPEADEVFNRLLTASSNQYITRQTQFSLALSLEKQNKSDAAVDRFRKVARLGDARLAARALARAGTIRFRQKQYERAAALYDQIVTRFPDSRLLPAAALNAGLALYRVKKFEGAILRFGQVPDDSKENTEATLLTGMSLARLNRPDEAKSRLNAAFEAGGNSTLATEALFEMARLEQVAGKHDPAAQMFTDLAERWPDSIYTADALFNAASLRLALKDIESTERLLLRLKSEFPARATQPRATFLTARVLLERNNPVAARKSLDQVINADNADPRSVALSLYYISRIDHDGKQFKLALNAVQRLRPMLDSDANQDLRGALALGAMSAVELKEFKTAEELSTEFLQYGLKDGDQATDARAARMVARASTGDYTAAILDADYMIRTAANNPQTWTVVLRAAELAWDQKEYAAALELFIRANNALAPVSTQQAGASGSAWCLFQQGQFKEAAESFNNTARSWPDSSGGLEAQYMAVRSLHELELTDTVIEEYASLSKNFAIKAPDARTQELRERLYSYALDAGRTAARLLHSEDRTDDANKQWAALADGFADNSELDTILDEWAWINLKAEHYATADEIYRRLLKECPESPFAGTARLSLAESDLNAERMDEAINEFQAIVDHPKYADTEKAKALFHLIDINAEQQSWQDVTRLADQFAATHSVSPLAPRVQLLHADALVALNQSDIAGKLLQLLRQGVLEQQLKAAPWTERIWVVLGEIALAAKEYKDVDALAEEFSMQFPESKLRFQMDYLLGRRWKNQPEPLFGKAREFFEAVIYDEFGRGTHTAARSQFLIADTRLMEKDYAGASREYFKVSTLYGYPDLQAQALYQAGACQLEIGQAEEAVETWQSLIKDFPESAIAKDAEQRLKESAAN